MALNVFPFYNGSLFIKEVNNFDKVTSHERIYISLMIFEVSRADTGHVIHVSSLRIERNFSTMTAFGTAQHASYNIPYST